MVPSITLYLTIMPDPSFRRSDALFWPTSPTGSQTHLSTFRKNSNAHNLKWIILKDKVIVICNISRWRALIPTPCCACSCGFSYSCASLSNRLWQEVEWCPLYFNRSFSQRCFWGSKLPCCSDPTPRNWSSSLANSQRRTSSLPVTACEWLNIANNAV